MMIAGEPTPACGAIRLPRAKYRGQALLGAIVVVALLSVLVAGLTDLVMATRQGGVLALRQMTAMAAAESGLNVATRVLVDTFNQVTTPNWLADIGYCTPEVTTSWGTSWGAIQAQFVNVFAASWNAGVAYSGGVPYELSGSAPISMVQESGTVPGPAGPYTWEAIVGIVPVPNGPPTWTPGSSTTCGTSPPGVWTIPVALRGHAWVWGPDQAYVGEVTLYSPGTGAVTMNWTNGGAYATSIQLTLPPGSLLMNDPNVAVPPHP